MLAARYDDDNDIYIFDHEVNTIEFIHTLVYIDKNRQLQTILHTKTHQYTATPITNLSISKIAIRFDKQLD